MTLTVYPAPTEVGQRLVMALNAGILASGLFVVSVLIYRAACRRDSKQFFSEKKWFTLSSLPLLAFFPIGTAAGGAVVLYFILAKPKLTDGPNQTSNELR